MRITLDLDEDELTHTLEALTATVDALERRTDHLVAPAILQGVIAKIVRAVKEQQ